LILSPSAYELREQSSITPWFFALAGNQNVSLLLRGCL